MRVNGASAADQKHHIGLELQWLCLLATFITHYVHNGTDETKEDDARGSDQKRVPREGKI